MVGSYAKKSRRDFLKRAGLFISGLILPGCKQNSFKHLDVRTLKPRNILLIMGDHWRYDWLSIRGAGYLKTPNIDALAKNGLVFTQAVCNAPQCAPSRISFASGLYGHKLGAYENGHCVYPAKTHGYKKLLPAFYNILRDNGYRVGLVGKLDLYKKENNPSVITGDSGSGYPLTGELGFTDSFETLAKWKGNPGIYLINYFAREDWRQIFLEDMAKREYGRGREFEPWPLPTGCYWDHVIAQKGIELLNQFHVETPEKSWNLNLHFQAPHPPFDAPKEYLQMYDGVKFPDSIASVLEDKPGNVRYLNKVTFAKWNSSPDYTQMRKKHFAAMMSVLDDCIGKVIETLKKNGQYENTLIILTSDHGEMNGDFGLWSKQQMYEGSVRVPLIISWPGIKNRGKSDVLAELVDIYPTVLDFAETEYDRSRIDGKSLMPVMMAKTNCHKKYQFSEFGSKKEWPYAKKRMVFDGQYKLIDTEGFLELYNLKEDPCEMKNISKQRLKLVAKLYKVMNKFSEDAIPPQILR